MTLVNYLPRGSAVARVNTACTVARGWGMGGDWVPLGTEPIVAPRHDVHPRPRGVGSFQELLSVGVCEQHVRSVHH